jgi:hypothetical protein
VCAAAGVPGEHPKTSVSASIATNSCNILTEACVLLQFLVTLQVYQENIYQDERPFVAARKVMKEMGEPYASGVELLSFHTVSKVGSDAFVSSLCSSTPMDVLHACSLSVSVNTVCLIDGMQLVLVVCTCYSCLSSCAFWLIKDPDAYSVSKSARPPTSLLSPNLEEALADRANNAHFLMALRCRALVASVGCVAATWR